MDLQSGDRVERRFGGGESRTGRISGRAREGFDTRHVTAADDTYPAALFAGWRARVDHRRTVFWGHMERSAYHFPPIWIQGNGDNTVGELLPVRVSNSFWNGVPGGMPVCGSLFV